MIPITLSLNFSLVGKPIPSLGNLQPMLAPDTPRYLTASVSLGLGSSGGSGVWPPGLGETPRCLPSQLPFEKNCGDDHVCQDDLGITVDASG